MKTPFEHLRHKPPESLERPRELIVAVPQLQSNVNLARILRTCGCCGVRQVVACGTWRVDPKIARDALASVQVTRPRSLLPTLERLKSEGYPLVGLEQTTGSVPLPEYPFVRRSVLVLGHERRGIDAEILAALDDVVEIPVFGQPFSYNVATATAMALYEYCRQFPRG